MAFAFLRGFALFVALAAVSCAWAATALARQGSETLPAETRTYGDVADVVSADFVFPLEALGFAKEAQPKVSDLSLEIDSGPIEIRALEPVEAGEWQVVVLFDAERLDARALRWGASLLAEKAQDLAALGTVEIVVADPHPRWILGQTDDLDSIERSLSHLALQPGDVQHRTRARRQEFLGLLSSDYERERVAALVPELIRQEQVANAAAEDRLVSLLAEAGSPGAAKLLVLVTEGSDEAGEAFFARALELGRGDVGSAPAEKTHEAAGPQEGEDPVGFPVGRESAKVARPPLVDVASAFGWRVWVVAQAPARPPADRVGLLRSLEIRLDGNWDPEKARAFAELGRVFRRQGDLSQAEENLKRAVYHFFNHPKNHSEQAQVLLELGALYEASQRWSEARKSFEAAMGLDESLADEVRLRAELLVDPLAVPGQLAQRTQGDMIQRSEALELALGRARASWRVSFQGPTSVPGEGSFHELPALGLKRLGARSSVINGRYRMGTPLAVSWARLRLLGGEGWADGGLLVNFVLQPSVASTAETSTVALPEDGTRALRLETLLSGPSSPPSVEGASSQQQPSVPSRFRLSWAELGSQEAEPFQYLEQSLPQEQTLLEWSLLGVDSEAGELLVTLEDLRTGTWTSAWLSVPKQ